MQPHTSFDTYSPYIKPHSYHQQPSLQQQKSPLSPVPSYPTRNNYHYNYSPSHNTLNKQMNASVQEPFYKGLENGGRPQSNKEKKQGTNGVIMKNQGSVHNQANSHSHINTQQPNHTAKFSASLFPNTSKLMNLQKFIEQNINLRQKLLQQLQNINEKRTTLKLKNIISLQHDKTKASTRDTTPKRVLKDKASTLVDRKGKTQTIGNARSSQALTQEQQLTHLLQLKRHKQQHLQTQKNTLKQLQKANTHRRQHLQKLQAQTMNQSIHQTPLLREKQLAIQCLSVEIEWMNEKNTEIKRLVNTKNDQNSVFEMYQKMCREVERLRKENNKKSQRLKKLFEKTNQLTNKEENANMFLMNLKV